MASATVSDIARPVPQFVNEKSEQPPKSKSGGVPANADGNTPKESRQVIADTVNISYQSKRTVAEEKKEEAKKEARKNETNSEKANGAVAKVQFVYNLKGELSIRYMDTANRVIYQVPSELMMRLAETASKPDSSVDTKA